MPKLSTSTKASGASITTQCSGLLKSSGAEVGHAGDAAILLDEGGGIGEIGDKAGHHETDAHVVVDPEHITPQALVDDRGGTSPRGDGRTVEFSHRQFPFALSGPQVAVLGGEYGWRGA